MKYFLSRRSRSVLTTLTHQRPLLAFDFDGTLSPIVADPGAAAVSGRTRKLLRRLVARFPCVVISGRKRAGVLRRLGKLKFASVIGNHGAETAQRSKASPRRVQDWKRELEIQLREVPGLWMEDKGLSLSIHYRRSLHKSRARRQIFAAAKILKDVRVFGGKDIVNVVPRDAPHKGEALAVERDKRGCNWVLYVGDDENDEDAFSLNGNVVSVRIGRKRSSHAEYYLRNQSEIDNLLELLILEGMNHSGPSDSRKKKRAFHKPISSWN